MDPSELPSNLRIGTRRSQLAVTQTLIAVEVIKKSIPYINMEIVKIETKGDLVLTTALPKIGEKSLFTKELEEALLQGTVDLVVHSLKDLPTTIAENTVICTVLERDSPYDVIVFSPSNQITDFSCLSTNCVIGTSSIRRVAQIKSLRPDLRFKNIRGNLNTRLSKLSNLTDGYDAIILAHAGIRRLGIDGINYQVLNDSNSMYAVGQGALAIQCRSSDVNLISSLSRLSNIQTLLATGCERAFLRTMEGGCSVPIAVSSHFDEQNIYTFKAAIFNVDDGTKLDASKKFEMPISATYSGDGESETIHQTVVPKEFVDIFNKFTSSGNECAADIIDRGCSHHIAASQNFVFS